MIIKLKREEIESLEMKRARNPKRETMIARMIYYTIFSVGVLLIAYAGDFQSPFFLWPLLL